MYLAFLFDMPDIYILCQSYIHGLLLWINWLALKFLFRCLIVVTIAELLSGLDYNPIGSHLDCKFFHKFYKGVLKLNFLGERCSSWKWWFRKAGFMFSRLNGNVEFACMGLWFKIQIWAVQATDHQSRPGGNCRRLVGGLFSVEILLIQG